MLSRLALPTSLVAAAAAHGWMVHPVSTQPGAPDYSLKYTGPTEDPWAKLDLSHAWYTNGIQCDGTTCETPTTQCASGRSQNPAMCPGKSNLTSSCGVIWLCHPNSTRPFGPDCDGRRYVGQSQGADWAQGSLQEVAYSISASHGGYSGYRLCKRDEVGLADYGNEGKTEQCFQLGHLPFEGDTCVRCPNGEDVSCYEAKERVGEHNNVYREVREVEQLNEELQEPCGGPVPKGPVRAVFSIVEHVRVPENLEPGAYVLSWRWDTADTSQVWTNCADVNIVSSRPAPLTSISNTLLV